MDLWANLEVPADSAGGPGHWSLLSGGVKLFGQEMVII